MEKLATSSKKDKTTYFKNQTTEKYENSTYNCDFPIVETERILWRATWEQPKDANHIVVSPKIRVHTVILFTGLGSKLKQKG